MPRLRADLAPGSRSARKNPGYNVRQYPRPQLSALTDWAGSDPGLKSERMTTTLPPTRSAKSQYTEGEAAEELGISIDRLRTMIRSHVVERDEDLNNIPVTTFQPSDL